MNDWSGVNDDDSGFEGTDFDRMVQSVYLDARQSRKYYLKLAKEQLAREAGYRND